MQYLARGFRRIVFLSCLIVSIIVFSSLYGEQKGVYRIKQRAIPAQQVLMKGATPEQQRLDLDEQECRAAYPGMFVDIDTGVARGKFVLERSEPDYKGLVQGRIKDGNLHILTTSPSTVPQILHQRTATLSQLHRALVTSRTPLPSTHFALCINDTPKNNTWGFSKPNKAHAAGYNTWLMPPFSSWAWPDASIGPMDAVLARIDAVEAAVPWARKEDKVVWRGTPWFNPLGHPTLRQDVLKATRGKEWADVAALNYTGTGHATNRLGIEEFCRYRYVLYTEGVTYSGRLPYHQACESVLIMAPVTWVTSSAVLVRGIGVRELMAGVGAEDTEGRGDGGRGGVEAQEKLGTTTGPIDTLLPPARMWEEANAVYVKPDFSDLETLLLFLRERPEVAQRIAQNLREGVVGGGYLGSAAEVCYWRALIRRWSKVAVVKEEDWGIDEGERYEAWLLTEVSQNRDETRAKSRG